MRWQKVLVDLTRNTASKMAYLTRVETSHAELTLELTSRRVSEIGSLARQMERCWKLTLEPCDDIDGTLMAVLTELMYKELDDC